MTLIWTFLKGLAKLALIFAVAAVLVMVGAFIFVLMLGKGEKAGGQ